MSELQSLLKQEITPHGLLVAIGESLRHDEDVYRFGSFSPSIYDSAWVSMVRRQDTSCTAWLFPESFDYLLRTQRENGTWESYATPVDGILNTLASLLALLEHRATDRPNGGDERTDLSGRIDNACGGLQDLLHHWCIEDTVHVGFEVLVPSLLSQVRQYGAEYDFDFPARQHLDGLRKLKTKKFKPEALYSGPPTTLLHSLEALVGIIDFDRIAHHCNKDTGIFGSPAATAAYLINASSWDHNAEAYLTTVINRSVGGSVPSAFPTVLFEASWAVSSLLATVVPRHDMQPQVIEDLASFFRRAIEKQSGVVGFAPGILEDADDTARVLLTLSYLGGVVVDLAPMIDKFQSDLHFRTYQFEGKPSFSANCNVLLALLSSPDPAGYSDQIQHILEYLISIYMTGKLRDKWNLSPYYSFMLLLDALIGVFEQVDRGRISQLPQDMLSYTMPITIGRVLSEMLNDQRDDGSWNNSVEETAYSMIAIAKCLTLPWPAPVRKHLLQCFNRAAGIVKNMTQGGEHDYVWVEKVTYSSALLRKVYQLIAIDSRVEQQHWGPGISASFATSEKYSTQLQPMLKKMPLFEGVSLGCIDLAFVEATRVGDRLRSFRNLIFPRDQLPLTKDRYLSFIPVIWSVCNQRRGNVLSLETIWEMSLHSMLIYQVDEYMETVVRDLSGPELSQLYSDIHRACELPHASRLSQRQGSRAALAHSLSELENGDPSGLEAAKSSAGQVIGAYIALVLQHESVLRLPGLDQRSISRSVGEFVCSHIVQNLNSRAHRDSQQDRGNMNETHTPFVQDDFFSWVRSSGAETTSCPLAFRQFEALLGPSAQRLYDGPRPRYLCQALGAHLATLCRMYNDYGSAVRDAEEGNLNCLDFGEFGLHSVQVSSDETAADAAQNGGASHTQRMKDQLLSLAQFERCCMERAFDALDDILDDPSTMSAIRVYIDVTDMFGQMYVLKDMSSRKMK